MSETFANASEQQTTPPTYRRNSTIRNTSTFRRTSTVEVNMHPTSTPDVQTYTHEEYQFPPDDMPPPPRESFLPPSGGKAPFLSEKESIVAERIELDDRRPSLLSADILPLLSEGKQSIVIEPTNMDSTQTPVRAPISSDPRYYPHTLAFPPNTQNVQRGGFAPLKNVWITQPNIRDWRAYPPYPNSRYELTSDARVAESKRMDAKFMANAADTPASPKIIPKQKPEPAIQNNIANSYHEAEVIAVEDPYEQLIRHHISVSRNKLELEADRYEPVRDKDGLTKGERLAKTIKWDRPTWVSHPPGACGPLLPAYEMRAEFVELIDSGVEMLFCKKCEKSHIPPGPPFTLQDRDTCGTMLPEWFPTEAFQKPWETYTQLMNEIIVFSEMEQGFNHRCDPSKPVWGLKWHEKDQKWKEIKGRREGFWKCRSGPNAPEAERECNQCHVPMTPEEEAAEIQRSIPIAARKAALVEWINDRIKEGGLKDRAAVEEMARMHGDQKLFGLTLTPRQVIQRKKTTAVIHRESTSFEDGKYDRPRGDFDLSPKSSILSLDSHTSSTPLLGRLQRQSHGHFQYRSLPSDEADALRILRAKHLLQLNAKVHRWLFALHNDILQFPSDSDYGFFLQYS